MPKQSKKRSLKRASKVAAKIEEDLSEVRQDNIDGGLFFVDKSGDEKVKNAIVTRTLKIDEIINGNLSNSAIPAMLSRKSLKSTTVKVESGFKHREMSAVVMHKIVKEAEKKKAAGILPGHNQRSKALKVKEKREKILHAKGGFDLWEEKQGAVKDEYVTHVLEKPVKRTILPDMRPSHIPAVAIVHPGASYKPTEQDHRENIIEAAEIEYAKEDLKEKIASELSYPKELDELVETEYLYDSESEGESEKEYVESSESELPKKRVEKANTRADINRKKKLKQTLQFELTIKQQKYLAKQLNKIKELEKEIISKELIDEEKKNLRDQLKAMKAGTRPKKLSRYAFQPTPVEVKLSDEIADSLRLLKPEGNLVKDRFKSFEARNLIETRIPVKKKRKYKQKVYESHDYKRFK